MSEAREKIKEFWSRDGNYDLVEAHGVHSEEEQRIWRDLFRKCIGSEQSLTILDMGTGTGFLALLLAEMDHDVTGADWSETMLGKAKLKVRDSSLPVRFVIEDAENLSFPDNQFDAVVSRHMLWTLTNPQKAINEWARVIKPGGKVFVDVPVGAVGKNHFNEEIGKKLPFYNGTQPSEISGLLEKAGFKHICEENFQYDGGKPVTIIRCEKK